MERVDFDSVIGPSCAAAIGFFDGVHLGHQAVLRRLVDVAKEASLPSVVLLFVPNAPWSGAWPEAFAASQSETDSLPFKAPEAAAFSGSVACPPGGGARLCASGDVMEMILNEGVDAVVPIPPDAHGSAASAPSDGFGHDVSDAARRASLDRLPAIFERVGARILITGDRAFAVPEPIRRVLVDTVTAGGEPVTTDRVLNALKRGAMEEVTALLGRPHFYRGRVVPGHRRGRTVGMPTANIRVAPGLQLPAFGVYGTTIEVRRRRYESITNIGTRPTVDDSANVTVETHILDFDEAIYGEEVKLEVHTYIRPIMKFDSIAGVRDQVRRDVASARSRRRQHASGLN